MGPSDRPGFAYLLVNSLDVMMSELKEGSALQIVLYKKECQSDTAIHSNNHLRLLRHVDQAKPCEAMLKQTPHPCG